MNQNREQISGRAGSIFTLGGAITAAALVFAQCSPVAAHAGAPSNADLRFVKAAARGGMAEVRLGKLAEERGASARVREFGQRMVNDHSAANDHLKDVAHAKHIALPLDIGAKNKATYNRLARLHGAAFDAAYIRDMRADHQEDISEFQREARSGRDAEVRAFARTTLPVLREHYRMITSISSHRNRMRAHRSRMGRM